jgi:hypothetical protein
MYTGCLMVDHNFEKLSKKIVFQTSFELFLRVFSTADYWSNKFIA